MIQNLKSSLILTFLLIVIFGVLYPLFIYTIGLAFPNGSAGSPVYKNGKITGFENIGQKFTSDRYFRGRPSAVNYNASSAGGSNKGPTDQDYLAEVNARIDTFLVHNPDIRKEDIPSEMVTASGSGIDPHISPQSAYIQVSRISKARNIPPEKIILLIEKNIQNRFLGKPVINVLLLNLALDEIN